MGELARLTIQRLIDMRVLFTRSGSALDLFRSVVCMCSSLF